MRKRKKTKLTPSISKLKKKKKELVFERQLRGG